jgi:hypothetical protein
MDGRTGEASLDRLLIRKEETLARRDLTTDLIGRFGEIFSLSGMNHPNIVHRRRQKRKRRAPQGFGR